MWADLESVKSGGTITAPATGTVNNLVIYIRFSDDSEFSITRQAYDDKFNSLTESSMKSYFNEVSYGMLNVNSTHYPACSLTTNLSFQDSHPRAYFKPYNATTNSIGYQNSTERREREQTLLKDAIDWLNINSPVSSGLSIDADNDGYVDNITFVVKGGAGGWADLLWAHKWSLYTHTVLINGKTVWNYTFLPENQAIIRTLSHEMFQVIGAPDLYHYYFDTQIAPVAQWDIMANGGGHITAYMKWKYTENEWISNIPEISNSGTYTLNPITSATNNCFRIASPNSTDEFFIVEYRHKSGSFETEVPGSGLIVYRVNPTVSGNAYGTTDEIYVYRPNGTLTVNGTPNSAHFSASVSRTIINDTTNPSCFLSSGLPGGLNISGISTADSTISFTVMLSNSVSLTVCSDPVDGGNICGSGVFNINDQVVLTAAPNSGFTFSGWKINNNIVSTDSVYSFIITQDLQVQACFCTETPQTIDIIVVNQNPNSGIVSGGGTYMINDLVVVSAEANSGFVFQRWMVDGNIVSTNADFEFIANSDIILNATFNVITSSEILNNEFVNVFPNPAADILYVDGVPAETQLIVSDIHNRIVYTEKMGNDVTGLDVSTLNSGVYKIKFLKEGKALARSFIKN